MWIPTNGILPPTDPLPLCFGRTGLKGPDVRERTGAPTFLNAALGVRTPPPPLAQEERLAFHACTILWSGIYCHWIRIALSTIHPDIYTNYPDLLWLIVEDCLIFCCGFLIFLSQSLMPTSTGISLDLVFILVHSFLDLQAVYCLQCDYVAPTWPSYCYFEGYHVYSLH